MIPRRGITFRQLFFLTLLGLTLLLGAVFYAVFRASRHSILQSAEQRRADAALRYRHRVLEYLHQADQALARVEQDLRLADISPDDLDATERLLFEEVLNHAQLSEISITRGAKAGFNEDGTLALKPIGRWELSVFRVAGDPNRISTRRIVQGPDAAFRIAVRDGPPGGAVFDAPLASAGTGADPTSHLTFVTAARRRNYGSTITTDLHWSQLDADRPEEQRRVELSVQKAIEARDHQFLGVVRVGLFADRVDELAAPDREDPADPHTFFVCDTAGRLVTPVTPGDHIGVTPDDDLRYPAGRAPPQVAGVLGRVASANLVTDKPIADAFAVAGVRYLASYIAMSGTQDWVAVIVAPEDAYLHDLRRAQRQLLTLLLAVMAAILIGGMLSLRAVQRGLSRITSTTGRMREFDFAPARTRTIFRDVRAVIESLELAKTAMRAMGKYVPIGLVRQLYDSNREPVLGASLATVTLMFSDVKDFTTLAEQLTGDALAQAMGRYFAVMTVSVHATGGIVDKYIGDSVMALWNVPAPIAHHARRACEAALDCIRATRSLYASADWAGLPAFHTRFGLHTADVMIGHFGAPDRMSYTAIGDGVNIASRLEGLNKQYGTSIIASEAVREAAGDAFRFRLLDVVAVQGKHRGVKIFELRGAAGDEEPDLEAIELYGRALAAYWERDFAGAADVLQGIAQRDPPSAVLAARCRELRAAAPPADWDGVYVAPVK